MKKRRKQPLPRISGLKRLGVLLLLWVLTWSMLQWSLWWRHYTLEQAIQQKIQQQQKRQQYDDRVAHNHHQQLPLQVLQIAYAISVTDCPSNATHTVLDGAAVLAHSIHRQSIRNPESSSRYDYKLYAFVHPTAAAVCQDPLQELGYDVQIKDLPFAIERVPPELRESMESKGCCGSKEYLKLHVLSLKHHRIAVHLDIDTLLVRPMDELFDYMLRRQSRSSSLALPSHHIAGIQHHLPSFSSSPNNTTDSTAFAKDGKQLDMFFTRDYHQHSAYSKNPKHYGVQGGFLVVRPNRELLNELTGRLLQETFHKRRGWSNKGYGGYWGASQIQGYLSYVIGEYYSDRALELNRCRYNTMISEDPMDVEDPTKCRTLEPTCEDCRDTPWEDVYLVHLTTCRKPWECPFLRYPTPLACRTAHKAWFETRVHLETTQWQQTPPKGGWNREWTLGYCTKPRNSSTRVYQTMQFPEKKKRVKRGKH